MSTIRETELAANRFFAEQEQAIREEGLDTTPRIAAAYQAGLIVGAVTDNDELPHDLRQYARNCRDEFRDIVGVNEYRFASASGTGDLYGDWEGQLCLPHLSLMKLCRTGFKERQLTGDCVSVAMRNMRDAARSYDIDVLKQAEEFVKRSASADLYAMRGHTGQGASPSRIATAATKIGILLETEITAPDGRVWDFRDYDSYYKIGVQYGRTGLPRWIMDLNRDYGPKQVAEAHEREELLTGLWNGCGAGIGSSMGVSKSGGKDGVAFLSALSGSWQHEMQILGFDDRKRYHRDTIMLMDQTWGNWNQITDSIWPAEYGPKPEGAYCLTLTDLMTHIRRGECHLFSDSHGFRPRRQATLGAEGLI